MRVIGIDPGTGRTGYGIIDVIDGRLIPVAYGVVTTKPKTAMPRRLQIIYEDITALIKEYKPDSAGIEDLFFGRNVTTAITVGQARGVILLALVNAGLPIGEYQPARIKEAVSGYGNADKQQMQLMVANLLDLPEIPKPDDAADGLAVAIAHYQYQRYASLVDQGEG